MTDQRVAGVDFGKLFASIDAMDTERFLGFIAEQATFRFGSAPAVTGHPDIRAAVDGFFSSIAGLTHDVRLLFEKDDVVVCEGMVTYTRHDGSSLTLPFANVFEVDRGLIGHYRIYVDIAPLYAS